MKKIIVFVFIILLLLCSYQFLLSQNGKLDSLTLEKIMSDPKWIGSSPSRIFWSGDSRFVYFYWNPDQAESDSLYRISISDGSPVKVSLKDQQKMPGRYGDYNRDRTLKIFEKDGDLYLYNLSNRKITRLTNTVDRESSPKFSFDEKFIIFMRNGNLYSFEMRTGVISQLTDFRRGQEPRKRKIESEQEKWLKQQQLSLFEVLKKRKESREQREKTSKKFAPKKLKPIYLGKNTVRNVDLSPDMRYVIFGLYQRPANAKNTVVPNYVTESGFTEDIPSRTKVGAPQGKMKLKIYDIERDTVLTIKYDNLPGIFDEPEYLKLYQNSGKDSSNQKTEKKKQPREVRFTAPIWSNDGKNAIILISALDNKDFWIARLDLKQAKLDPLYRYHDEAWIGGPGLRFWRASSSLGWLPDNQHIWFQSEESGYNHLYTLDIQTGEKKQLTKGKFEIYSPSISRDKKYWYFTSNEVHPGERHFYRMNLDGSNKIRITSLTGSNRVYMSPDEKCLAILYSCTNKPWELFLMKNKPGAKLRKITNSVSEEFLSYPWRDPEIITFEARDGAKVSARLYRPDKPQNGGPAVIFVHGAGYLQNAHKWWSSYFREYMFHNFLADHGYTVLDIDYRGSAGYGRDWRTAIYRNMGGKDLSDQVDGARFLVEKFGVDAKKIGIYGGSYGGFITLMAMFKEPDIFAAGAALRPVTDWAHYNHGYTSDILNVPYLDSLAYVNSSPIYHAEGLKGALLICHGVVDRNVHFQDVVRLVQRLIELKKENWQLAIYPVEDHGFREPTSWLDEYRRIFKLFEENLK